MVESSRWTVAGTVAETHLGKTHAFTQNLAEGSVSASQAAGSGGRIGSGRSAGVPSMGLAGVPGGAALPSALATGSPLSVFQYTLSRADRLAMYRYFIRCFTDPNVAITMRDGTVKPLCEIEVGEEVLNRHGKPVRVRENTNQHHEGMVYSLMAAGTKPVEVTEEHPFWVLRKDKITREVIARGSRTTDPNYLRKTLIHIDYQPEWVEAKDVQKGDFLIVPKSGGGGDDIDPRKARLLGYYLAEGNPNHKDRLSGKVLTNVTWSLGSHETDLIEEICCLVEEVTGERPSVYGPYEDRETVVAIRTKEGNEKHRELTTWLVKHGGHLARHKRLSEEIFNCGDETAKHLLACWLNGDGHQEHKRCVGQVYGATTSLQLSNQLYLMMGRIGLTAAKYEGRSIKDGVDKGPKWSVYVPAQYANVLADYSKWESVEKKFRHRKFTYEGNMLLPVTKVDSRMHEGTIYNISTEGEDYDDRTFLVEGLATHNTDPFVARAIELHAELPLSRLSIGQPRGPDTAQNSEITRVYENLSDRLGLLQFLLDVAREYWGLGDVYVWMEWDEEIQEWSDLYILPIEYCHSVLHPFMRRQELIIFARPLVDTASIRRMTDRDLYMLAGDPDLERLMEDLDEDLPEDLRELLDYGDAQPLNTDPDKGSYCFHLSRNRPPNEAYGQGLIERCLETLIRLENLKNAQLQISGRNMQPKHLIFGEALSSDELDDLRTQVDLSLLENVDYPIVTNYRVEWQTIGANERLLNVSDEYNVLREDLAAGLGTTRDLITGQATYGGQRITLELMNTQYMTFRELMKDFVERGIFRPVSEAKGHYYYEEIDTWIKTTPEELEAGDDVIQEYDGELRKRQVQVNKVYNHSQLRFNRLSIRDNTEVYDQLFQLHQKGSLALRYLLDLHNIDPEENAAALLEDMGTVRDPTFNRLIENLYGGMTDQIIQNTNLVDRVIEGMNLDVKSQVDNQPAPGTSPEASLMGGGPMPMDTLGMGPDIPGMEGGLPPLEGGPEGIGLPGEPAVVPGELPGAPGAPPPASKKKVGGPRIRNLAARKLDIETVDRLALAGRQASSINKRLSPKGIKKIIARSKRDRNSVKIRVGSKPTKNGRPRNRLTKEIMG